MLLLSWWTKTPENHRTTQVKLRLTHEEIAEVLGTTRETVSRLFSKFKKKQLLQLKGSNLVIRNRRALEKIAPAGIPEPLSGVLMTSISGGANSEYAQRPRYRSANISNSRDEFGSQPRNPVDRVAVKYLLQHRLRQIPQQHTAGLLMRGNKRFHHAPQFRIRRAGRTFLAALCRCQLPRLLTSLA